MNYSCGTLSHHILLPANTIGITESTIPCVPSIRRTTPNTNIVEQMRKRSAAVPQKPHLTRFSGKFSPRENEATHGGLGCSAKLLVIDGSQAY
jgi:hypothetical protein